MSGPVRSPGQPEVRPRRGRRRSSAAGAADSPEVPEAIEACCGSEAPPTDIEHAGERRAGPIEAAAPRPDPNEGVTGFLEPDDTQVPDEPLLQPARGT
ncbi:MAG: hypothetical protein Q7T97_03410 [Burkholderiaceae bacterium]|nr:hypothetical protein [Burkholderiaceae bacterium]